MGLPNRLKSQATLQLTAAATARGDGRSWTRSARGGVGGLNATSAPLSGSRDDDAEGDSEHDRGKRSEQRPGPPVKRMGLRVPRVIEGRFGDRHRFTSKGAASRVVEGLILRGTEIVRDRHALGVGNETSMLSLDPQRRRTGTWVLLDPARVPRRIQVRSGRNPDRNEGNRRSTQDCADHDSHRYADPPEHPLRRLLDHRSTIAITPAHDRRAQKRDI